MRETALVLIKEGVHVRAEGVRLGLGEIRVNLTMGADICFEMNRP